MRIGGVLLLGLLFTSFVQAEEATVIEHFRGKLDGKHPIEVTLSVPRHGGGLVEGSFLFLTGQQVMGLEGTLSVKGILTLTERIGTQKTGTIQGRLVSGKSLTGKRMDLKTHKTFALKAMSMFPGADLLTVRSPALKVEFRYPLRTESVMLHESPTGAMLRLGSPKGPAKLEIRLAPGTFEKALESAAFVKQGALWAVPGNGTDEPSPAQVDEIEGRKIISGWHWWNPWSESAEGGKGEGMSYVAVAVVEAPEPRKHLIFSCPCQDAEELRKVVRTVKFLP